MRVGQKVSNGGLKIFIRLDHKETELAFTIDLFQMNLELKFWLILVNSNKAKHIHITRRMLKH